MYGTIYNPRIVIRDILIPLPSHIRRIACVVLAIFTSFLSSALGATDWSAPETDLARKIATNVKVGPVALEITNRSSLREADFEAIRQALQGQVAALGLRLVKADQASSTIRIFLSENLQEYVWTAQIYPATGDASTILVTAPRVEMPLGNPEMARVVIHRLLLWTQPERILDIAILEGAPVRMAILESSQVSLYKQQYGRWQVEQILGIPPPRPWPRDLRGRLVVGREHLLEAYLPGLFCQSTANIPLAWNCGERDDPWPVGTDPFTLGAFFTPARNYFTGVLAPGAGKLSTTAAFYAAAVIPREKETLWLFSGLDGRVHILDGVSDHVAANLAWGSDLASVHSGCGNGWQVLATGNGEALADSIRAVELADQGAIAVSSALELGGPVTALWTESSGSNAIAVSHNAQTGDYEAFRLSLSCN